MSVGRVFAIFATACTALALSGAAMAQQGRGGSAANNGPGALSAADPYGSNASLREAMDSMQAGSYVMAERKFLEFLKGQPKEPRANFMLGVTEMQLGKWVEAKKYLEVAVAASAREPDPKSRLAVTLIKLGDMAGAEKQRADLAKMDAACQAKCINAKWIKSDLEMVDAAIAEAKAAQAPAAAPVPH